VSRFSLGPFSVVFLVIGLPTGGFLVILWMMLVKPF
jgi:hypothetical protein